MLERTLALRMSVLPSRFASTSARALGLLKPRKALAESRPPTRASVRSRAAAAPTSRSRVICGKRMQARGHKTRRSTGRFTASLHKLYACRSSDARAWPPDVAPSFAPRSTSGGEASPIGGAVVVALVAAVVLSRSSGAAASRARPRPGRPSQSRARTCSTSSARAEDRVQGCAMWIRFTWRPDYHADQYIDAPALISASGSRIQGTYRKLFRENGVSIELGPVRSPAAISSGRRRSPRWTAIRPETTRRSGRGRLPTTSAADRGLRA